MRNLLRKIDSLLIANHPHAWLLKLHYVLPISFFMISLYSAAALLTDIDTTHVPDYLATKQLLIVVPSILIALWWVYIQGRDRLISTVNKKKRPEIMLTTLGMTFCLVLFFSPPFVYTAIMLQRVQHLVSPETLEHDKAQLEYLNQYFGARAYGYIRSYYPDSDPEKGAIYPEGGTNIAEQFADEFMALKLNEEQEREIEVKLKSATAMERYSYLKKYNQLVSMKFDYRTGTRDRIEEFFETTPKPITKAEWEAARKIYPTLSPDEQAHLFAFFTDMDESTSRNRDPDHSLYTGQLSKDEISRIFKEYSEKVENGQPAEILYAGCHQNTSPYDVPQWVFSDKINVDEYRNFLRKCRVPRLRLDSADEDISLLNSDDQAVVALAVKKFRDSDYESTLVRKKVRVGLLLDKFKDDLLFKVAYDSALLQKDKFPQLEAFLSKYNSADAMKSFHLRLEYNEHRCDYNSGDNPMFKAACMKIAVPDMLDQAFENIQNINIVKQFSNYELYILFAGCVLCLFGLSQLLCIASLVPIKHFVVSVGILITYFFIEICTVLFLMQDACNIFDCGKNYYVVTDILTKQIPTAFLLSNLVIYLFLFLLLNKTKSLKKMRFSISFAYITTSIATSLIPLLMCALIPVWDSELARSPDFVVFNNFVDTSEMLFAFAGPALYVCLVPWFEAHAKRLYTLPE